MGFEGSPTSDRKKYQRLAGGVDEVTAEKNNQRTAPQMNIGPNMGRENMASNIGIQNEAANLTSRIATGRTPKDISAEVDEYEKGVNEGKEIKDISWNKAPNFNYKKGGKVSSASSRADGCAQRGKTKGRMV